MSKLSRKMKREPRSQAQELKREARQIVKTIKRRIRRVQRASILCFPAPTPVCQKDWLRWHERQCY